MTKTPARLAMERALRPVIDTHLRAAGFTGRFPHLRRLGPDRVDLVTFQFFSAGGAFVVEVGSCPADGITTYWDEHIGPEQVRVAHLPMQARARIGSPSFPEGDHWFVFGPRTGEPGSGDHLGDAHYARVAGGVADAWRRDAEAFWRAPLRGFA